MKNKINIDHGSEIPRGYRPVKYLYDRLQVECWIMPLNYIVKAWYWITDIRINDIDSQYKKVASMMEETFAAVSKESYERGYIHGKTDEFGRLLKEKMIEDEK